MSQTKERVKPITIKNTENGDVFTLEFNRESIRFAESKGFDVQNVENSPMTSLPDLFFYAFRMHHRNINRFQTDKILFEDLGGLSEAMIERLAELYSQPFNDLIQDEETTKNSKVTIEM